MNEGDDVRVIGGLTPGKGFGVEAYECANRKCRGRIYLTATSQKLLRANPKARPLCVSCALAEIEEHKQRQQATEAAGGNPMYEERPAGDAPAFQEPRYSDYTIDKAHPQLKPLPSERQIRLLEPGDVVKAGISYVATPLSIRHPQEASAEPITGERLWCQVLEVHHAATPWWKFWERRAPVALLRTEVINYPLFSGRHGVRYGTKLDLSPHQVYEVLERQNGTNGEPRARV